MKVRVMLVREGRRKEVTIDSAAKAFLFMRDKARRLDREHLWRIDLDARSGCLGLETVSVGTANASLVHPREVFKGAILNNATGGIIVAHNHPSGDVTPSDEDKDATKRLFKSGELLGIPLLDHLILSDSKYFSFREAGLL